MSEYIRRIAVGPTMSKDLERDEARRGMAAVLDGSVDPVQAAIFLVALRMKRETLAENLGVLDALRAATTVARADVPELVDLADPYDGYERMLPANPFLPAVLAACGLPTVSHGCTSMPPKDGATHRSILEAAGIDCQRSPAEVAARIADPAIGWGYVDVTQFSPAQAALIALRRLIVKRPCLSTLEKLCAPVRAERLHLVVGYVHIAYQSLLGELAQDAGYTSALVIKGAEGGVVPKLQRTVTTSRLVAGTTSAGEWPIDPTTAGITAASPVPPVGPAESLVADAAQAGLAALTGSPGLTRDALVLTAAMVLLHLGRQPDLAAAADHVRQVLDTGAAHRHCHAG